MIPLSKHTAQILGEDRVPIPVDPVQVTLGMDDEWSPYLQGRITVHSSDAALLERDRVVVRLRQAFGPDMSIASLTEWADGSIARLTVLGEGSVQQITAAHTHAWNPYEVTLPLEYATELWGAVLRAVPGSVAKITDAMRQPGGSFDPPPAQYLEALVRVRPATRNHGTGLLEFELDGEEIALHDYRRAAADTWTSPHTSLRALVAYMVNVVGGELIPGGDVPIVAGATWSPGQTIWDALHPVLEAADWRLTADLDGRYRIDPAGVDPSPIVLDYDENLIDYRDEVEPEYDAAIVEYNAVTPPEYDIYMPAGARRVMHETRYTTKPGAGAAQALVARATARGKSARATCTSLYNLRPRARVDIGLPDGSVRGTISQVEWRYPASRMTLTARDIT